MIKSAALTAALTAGAMAVTVAALPASGRNAAGPRTLKFTSTEKQRDSNSVDVKPKGESVGDRFTFSSTLHLAGKTAGRVEADCVAVDRTYEGLQCALVVILRDGRLTLQGAGVAKRIPGVGRASEAYAVTSGTGAYAGASGTMRRKAGTKRDTLTFSLDF